jgi:hypothetical protein
MGKARDWGDVGVEGGPGAIRREGDDPATDIPFDDAPPQPNGNGGAYLTEEELRGPREPDYPPDGPSVNAEQAPDTKPPVILHAFNPADWEGKKAPPRKSIVPDHIPDETVTLLYADGGTGKSYLKLQLAVARALAKEWIGLLPEPGRTLVLSTEDDLDEMWRRIEGMLPFFSASMADLGDIRLVDLVGENSVLGLLTRGIIEPTPMYDALDRYMADFKPGLVELDVLADLFSGEENNRPQVTQFVGLLKRLCRKHHCAALLLAQPSLTGMNTGSGTSGSTGWSNSPGSISRGSRPAKAPSPTKTCGPSKARKRTTAKSAVSLTSNGRMDFSAASSARPALPRWLPIKRPKTCSFRTWRASPRAGAV